jgi:hypothetical protein
VAAPANWVIVPEGDLQSHTASEHCTCKPIASDVYDEDGVYSHTVYVHNSWDGREFRERLKGLQ